MPGQQPSRPLTRRELETLRLWVRGYDRTDIARRMGISLDTVKTYLGNIRKQAGPVSRYQVAEWYYQMYLPWVANQKLLASEDLLRRIASGSLACRVDVVYAILQAGAEPDGRVDGLPEQLTRRLSDAGLGELTEFIWVHFRYWGLLRFAEGGTYLVLARALNAADALAATQNGVRVDVWESRLQPIRTTLNDLAIRRQRFLGGSI